MHVNKWLYEEWKVYTQITVTLQTQISVRHLLHFEQPVNDGCSRKVLIMTMCIVDYARFQKDCQTIFVRLKELFLSRSVRRMQVLHPIILNFISFGRHTV